jgi:hypothetical protein
VDGIQVTYGNTPSEWISEKWRSIAGIQQVTLTVGPGDYISRADITTGGEAMYSIQFATKGGELARVGEFQRQSVEELSNCVAS